MASAFGGKAKEEPPMSQKDVETLHAKIWPNCQGTGCFGRCLQSHPRHWRQKAVTRDHPDLRVRRQCSLLSPARSSLYYHLRGETTESLAFMEIIDRQFLEPVVH